MSQLDYTTEVAIIGGGLQGCCIALELAKHDIDVLLIEQDTRLMNRASLKNEGKVHLGLVYAKDSSLNTGRLQLRGALSFYTLLHRWTGCSTKELNISKGFHYLVANGSLLSTDELNQYYEHLSSIYEEYVRQVPGLDYMQTTPVKLAEPMQLSELAKYYDSTQFLGGFRTAELAIDPYRLARIIRAAAHQSERIKVVCGTKVERVLRNGSLQIECMAKDRPCVVGAEQVVNAAWVNRLAIDEAFGLPIAPGWVHRLKYRVICGLRPELRFSPSATVVLGRYGDVVVRPDRTVYLSWYPTAMRGWSHDLSPPDTWNDLCRHPAQEELACEISREVLDSIGNWYPVMGSIPCITVDAGAIFAHGRSDVDDANSDLHQRSKVGITSVDGYHSVNPGKLTTAPLMAISTARRLLNKSVTGLGPIDCILDH